MSAIVSQKFQQIVKQAQQYLPLKTAVVHPVTDSALLGAIEAKNLNLIDPIFIGPQTKIQRCANELAETISSDTIIDVEHSHAAAEKAVELVRTQNAQMLMKGSLHTDELLKAILLKNSGLRTDRRLSHVFVLDVPRYPKLLFITDSAINIYPNLMEKRDIVQNAIDLSISLSIKQPKVAILSAVETVNPAMPATIDAAALCKMSEREQITGGLLDGPLAFDNAISIIAANIKGIASKVAGEADVLVAPDLEAANMLAKQLIYLADSHMAGIVLGARVPIVLTSRADNASARVVSCALAVLHAQNKHVTAIKV